MKILITGGAGFIGLHLAQYLSGLGHSVVIIDNTASNKMPKDSNNVKFGGIEFLEIDLCKGVNTSTIKKDFTHVIHLAALLGVQNVIDNAYNVLTENISMLSTAINIARSQTKLKQFIFASTSEVYAGTLNAGLLKIPSPETSQIVLPTLSQPRTSYMLSKLYGEAMCQQSGLPWLIIRPHNIYGPRMGFKHVIPQLMRKAVFSKNGELEVFSCDHRRTFCFINDAVEMIISLMTSRKTIHKIFNIGNEGPEVSMRDLAQEILRITGRDLIIRPMPATEGSPERRAPAMSNFSEVSKAGGSYTLSMGIEKTYQWYKATYHW